MRPEKIGRVLGIGLRVAGRVAGQRIAAGTADAGRQTAASAIPTAVAANQRGRAAGRAVANASRAAGGFFRPFRRVGGILWLEVTGSFFLLFVLFFAQNLWRLRASWAHGADHSRFLLYAVLTTVFLYLGLSSFWRASRR
jgi:hypothetical protein